MNSKYLIFIVVIVLFTSVSSYALNPSYSNTLIVTGPLYSGGGYSEFKFLLKEPAYDGVADYRKESMALTDQKTTCPKCNIIANPSQLVNCAGFVINKLFNIGPTNVGAPEVLDFCKRYGHKLGISDKLKTNDIVVYNSRELHVAIVTKDEGFGWLGNLLGLFNAHIQGKDNKDTVFEYWPGEDGYWGTPDYYRIEPKTLNTLQKSAILGTWAILYPDTNPGTITCPRDVNCQCPNEPKCDANPSSIEDKIVTLPNGVKDWNKKPKLNVVVTETPPYGANAYGTGNKGDPKNIIRTYRATFSNDPNPAFGDYSECYQRIKVECDKGQCCGGICGGSCSGGTTPSTTQDTYAVFLLTDIGGGSIWIGPEQDIQTHPHVRESDYFKTLFEATTAYCDAPISNVRNVDGGTKANIYGGDYWIDDAVWQANGLGI